MNDLVHDGHWMNGYGRYAHYKPWCRGEPNNAGQKEDCAAIRAHASCWNDAPCFYKCGVICKK